MDKLQKHYVSKRSQNKNYMSLYESLHEVLKGQLLPVVEKKKNQTNCCGGD